MSSLGFINIFGNDKQVIEMDLEKYMIWVDGNDKTCEIENAVYDDQGNTLQIKYKRSV